MSLPMSDAVAMVAAPEHQAGRLPDAQREFRRDHAVGAAANAVGAEIFARHVSPRPRWPQTLRTHDTAIQCLNSSKNMSNSFLPGFILPATKSPASGSAGLMFRFVNEALTVFAICALWSYGADGGGCVTLMRIGGRKAVLQTVLQRPLEPCGAALPRLLTLPSRFRALVLHHRSRSEYPCKSLLARIQAHACLKDNARAARTFPSPKVPRGNRAPARPIAYDRARRSTMTLKTK